jgi:hypothetical protein
MTADLIIVVPGIMGSVLKRGRIPVWDTSLRTLAHDLPRFDEFTRVLRLPPGLGDEAPDGEYALEPAGLINGWHLWPGKWAGAGYHDFGKSLRARFPAPGQVIDFAYDWRLSVRYNAAQLKKLVENRLGIWRERTRQPEARVVLLCHSMGGLIARFYTNFLDGYQVTSQVIVMGTPFSGSVKAARSLAGGIPLMPESLVKTLGSFPSVHQLLPTYRCLRGAQGMTAIGAEGLAGVGSAMIEDAFKLRAQSTAHRDSPPLSVFGGHRQGTLTSIQVAADALVFHETWLEREGDRIVESYPGGDATVPRFAAVPPEWSSDLPATFLAARHSGLPDDPLLLDFASQKIDWSDPRAYLGTELELGMDLPDIVSAKKPVAVRVRADDPNLRLVVRAADLRGNPAGPEVPLDPDGSGGYRASLALTPGVWHIEAATLARRPQVRIGDLVVVS